MVERVSRVRNMITVSRLRPHGSSGVLPEGSEFWSYMDSHWAFLCLEHLHEAKTQVQEETRWLQVSHVSCGLNTWRSGLRPTPQVNSDITQQLFNSTSRHSFPGKSQTPAANISIRSVRAMIRLRSWSEKHLHQTQTIDSAADSLSALSPLSEDSLQTPASSAASLRDHGYSPKSSRVSMLRITAEAHTHTVWHIWETGGGGKNEEDVNTETYIPFPPHLTPNTHTDTHTHGAMRQREKVRERPWVEWMSLNVE